MSKNKQTKKLEVVQQELVVLPVEVINNCIAYLNEKPHKEVRNLIDSIQSSAKLVEDKK